MNYSSRIIPGYRTDRVYEVGEQRRTLRGGTKRGVFPSLSGPAFFPREQISGSALIAKRGRSNGVTRQTGGEIERGRSMGPVGVQDCSGRF